MSAQVKAIIELRQSGLTYAVIAARLGVTRNIVAGALYRANVRIPQETWGKLSAEDTRAIRAAYESDAVSQSALARQYGVSRTTVHYLIHGKSKRGVA